MPRELEDYRDNLERLSARFPGRETIFITEAIELLGVHRQTLYNDKTFPKRKVGRKYIVPLIALAKWQSAHT